MKENIKSVGVLCLMFAGPVALMFVLGVGVSAIMGELTWNMIRAAFIFLMGAFGAPVEIGLFLSIVMKMDDAGFGYGCVFWYAGASVSRWFVPYLQENMRGLGYFAAFALVGLALWVFHLKTKG